MIIGVDASRALRARRTGTERYSLEILRHLLALEEAQAHRWRLYVDRPGALALFPQADAPGHAPGRVSVPIEVRLLPGRRLWTHRSLAREVRGHPPDALFVPAHVLPFLWPPRRLPASVVTVHDLGYRYFPEAHTRFQRLYLEWSTRWSAWAARRVIAVSQATAQDLVRFLRTPSGKIRVIHEAPPALPRVTEAQVRELVRRYGLARPYALHVGTLQPRKNLARLLEAYARIQPGGLPWDLVLAGGTGWGGQDLAGLARSLGIAQRVHFLGYVPDRDLPVLLWGAHLFVFPSLFEGFGLPVLEAQQMGVPVMCANNSALPEVAGDAAILVDPLDVEALAQAMLRLSRDEALRQELIAKGYENVKRFSWEKAARETLAVLEAAAKQP